MKFFIVALAIWHAIALSTIHGVLQEIQRRQAVPQGIGMIGDLINGATTEVGRTVRDCISNALSCEVQAPKTYSAPGDLGSAACNADACCVWDYLQQELVGLFRNENGTCNGLARASVRLGFHDAGSWSSNSSFGGADGSLLLNDNEIDRPENNGLQEIRTRARDILARYSRYSVGAADLVQFMHNIATVVCPLGPRMLTLVGRVDRNESNPNGLIPASDERRAGYLIELFQNKTISPAGLAALLGAHTVARQFFVDPSKAGQTFDSTPDIWDVNFYRETLSSTSPSGVLRLPADAAIAQNVSHFSAFADATVGQALWNIEYASAYLRLSLLGVKNINQLTDCTRVLPDALAAFSVSSPAAPSGTADSSSSHIRFSYTTLLTCGMMGVFGAL